MEKNNKVKKLTNKDYCQQYRETQKAKFAQLEKKVSTLENQVSTLEKKVSMLETVIWFLRELFRTKELFFPNKLPKISTPGGFVLLSTVVDSKK
mmetsp:Transcript_11776/g.23225  ORF Transcript_11776/g.23225 Transcript_11776/m.23225 type:complete len:94 (+) Transcript_11776:19-300(+)